MTLSPAPAARSADATSDAGGKDVAAGANGRERFMSAVDVQPGHMLPVDADYVAAAGLKARADDEPHGEREALQMLEQAEALLHASDAAVEAAVHVTLQLAKKHPEHATVQKKALALWMLFALAPRTRPAMVQGAGGLGAALSALKAHAEHAGVVEQALYTLTVIATPPEGKLLVLEQGGVAAALVALETHSEHPLVQEKALAVLCKVAGCEEGGAAVFREGGMEAAFVAMQGHARQPEVQEQALGTLCNTAVSEAGRARFLEAGGVEAALETLRAHTRHGGVQKHALGTLGNIADDPVGRGIVQRERGPQAALQALKNHPAHPGVHEQALYLLSRVAGSDAGAAAVLQLGAVSAALGSMQALPEEAQVQEEALGLLANLTSLKPGREAVLEEGGVKCAAAAMTQHLYEDTVQVNALTVLRHVCETKEGLEAAVREECVGVVMGAMHCHSAEPALVQKAIHFLKCVATHEDACSQLVTDRLFLSWCAALRGKGPLQVACASLLFGIVKMSSSLAAVMLLNGDAEAMEFHGDLKRALAASPHFPLMLADAMLHPCGERTQTQVFLARVHLGPQSSVESLFPVLEHPADVASSSALGYAHLLHLLSAPWPDLRLRGVRAFHRAVERLKVGMEVEWPAEAEEAAESPRALGRTGEAGRTGAGAGAGAGGGLHDFSDLLDDEETADVTFVVAGVALRAHRLILQASCCSEIFLGHFKLRGDTTIHVEETGSPRAFRVLLEFLYSGTVGKHATEDVELATDVLRLAGTRYYVVALQRIMVKALVRHLRTSSAAEDDANEHLLWELLAIAQELLGAGDKGSKGRPPAQALQEACVAFMAAHLEKMSVGEQFIVHRQEWAHLLVQQMHSQRCIRS